MITDTIKYIGVNDSTIDFFEGLFETPDGMSYNSYIILDEKIAVADSVEADFADEWFDNIERESGKKAPDYLIIHHMEPDHSANILNFAKKYPEAIIVSSDKSFKMMKNFFGTDFSSRRIIVKDGDTLSLGKHSLSFLSASMVHWPEVMVSYENEEKVLFSADAFGKFGTLNKNDDWVCEARRYYFGIAGKYGVQVQKLLSKIAQLDIKIICSLHGPVLKDNIDRYIGLYGVWSSYKAEEDGILIAYTSVYGNTKSAAELLFEMLKKRGKENVILTDLARCDMYEAVEAAFRYEKLVLASITYNADIFPFMREFITLLIQRGYSNRTVALIENGSWAPFAAKRMKEMLENCKNISFAKQCVTVLSALNDESTAQTEALANELIR